VCDHETSTKRGGLGPYKAVEPYQRKKERKKRKRRKKKKERERERMCYSFNVSLRIRAWFLFMNSKYVNMQFEGWLGGHVMISAKTR
jgi:hypothetical protein